MENEIVQNTQDQVKDVQMENQDLVQKLKSKNNKWLVIILLVISVVSVSAAVFFGFHYFQNINSEKQSVLNDGKDVSIDEDDEFEAFDSNFDEEFTEIISLVRSGEYEYEKNDYQGDLEFYQSGNIQLPVKNESKGGHPFVNVYIQKYEPGLVYTSGYEGFSWEVDMDRRVTYLKSLSEGREKKARYSPGVSSDEKEKVDVYSKKIDQLVYEVNDSYFKPAGSWTRTYTTYDEKNSRIIEINIVDLEAKTFEDNIYYPFEVIEIFESIESKLWYIHP